ncbi:alpha/beta hydrolases superfamily protein [Tanacetum coccineum]
MTKRRFKETEMIKNSKSDRKCFRCGDPIHLIGECPKPLKDKNQRALIGGSWSDSGEENDEKVNNETCLVAQASSEICLRVDLEPDEWIKDSGCSKHMTGNRKLFSRYKAYNGGNVIFGRNLRGNIIGKGRRYRKKRLICDEIKMRASARHIRSLRPRDSPVMWKPFASPSEFMSLWGVRIQLLRSTLRLRGIPLTIIASLSGDGWSDPTLENRASRSPA